MPQLARYPMIRIVSDGMRDLKILDANTGEEIKPLSQCARSIRWEMGPDGVAVAHLELVAVAVEVVGELPEITIESPTVTPPEP